MYITNHTFLYLKKKATEVLTHDLFQYKSSQYKHIQNQFIYMNIHVYTRQYQKK